MIEQLTAAGSAETTVFWCDVDREVEQAMLHQLFTAAVERDVLTGDQIARFLSEVLAMHAPGTRAAPDLPAQPPIDLEGATRSLLYIDERLSALCRELFGRRLLSDLERESLRRNLGSSRRQAGQQRSSGAMH